MTSIALGVLVAVAAQVTPVDLVERNSLGLTAMEAARTREQLKHLMARAGFSVVMTGEVCGDSACLRGLAKARGHVVVGVTLVKSKKAVSVDLEAVDAAKVVLQQTFLAAPGELDRNEEAAAFVAALAERLEVKAVADAPVADAPVVERKKDPELTLAPREEPVAWTQAEPKSNVGPKVLLAGAGAVLAGGVALLIAGAVSAGALEQRLQVQPVVGLTRAEARAQADGANALMAAGTTASLVGVGLAVTSVVLLVNGTPRAEPSED